MKKRYLLFFLLFLIALPGCDGCNSKITNNGQRVIYTTEEGKKDAELSLPVSNLNLVIGDEYHINPSYNKLEGYTLSYSASNSNVTINNYGVIKAVKAGDTEVSVIYSNGVVGYTKTLNVNVSFGDYVPVVKLSTQSSLALEAGDTYSLNPMVEFRNISYNDAKFTFESLDESICTVSDNGVVTALKNGNTKILINATWKGKNNSSYPSLSTYVDVDVVYGVRFYHGSEVMSDIDIYMIDNVDGIEYPTSITTDFKIEVNGNLEPCSYEIDKYYLFEIDDNSIETVIACEATITLFKEIDGKTYSSTYKLNAIRPVVTIDEIVPMFSIEDGLYYDAQHHRKEDLNSFVNALAPIEIAYQGDNELTVSSANIYGVKSSSNVKRGTATIYASSRYITYVLTLETITKVISTKEDLKYLELNDKDITGYIELSNNIDAQGMKITQPNNNHYFTGIFNGCGYTIYNLDISNSSLFGSLYSSSKIMNLGLKNLNASNANYFANRKSSDSVYVDNVYIELSEDTVNPMGMFVTSPSNNVITNLVIVYLGDNASKAPDYTLSGYQNQSLVTSNQYYTRTHSPETQTKKWNNVICISPYVLGFRAYETVLRDEDDKTNYAAYYFGVNEEVDYYGNSLSTGEHERPIEVGNCDSETYFDIIYKEVYHFKTYNELSQYHYDYSSFNDKYWTISDGIITWKN